MVGENVVEPGGEDPEAVGIVGAAEAVGEGVWEEAGLLLRETVGLRLREVVALPVLNDVALAEGVAPLLKAGEGVGELLTLAPPAVEEALGGEATGCVAEGVREGEEDTEGEAPELSVGVCVPLGVGVAVLVPLPVGVAVGVAEGV